MSLSADLLQDWYDDWLVPERDTLRRFWPAGDDSIARRTVSGIISARRANHVYFVNGWTTCS